MYASSKILVTYCIRTKYHEMTNSDFFEVSVEKTQDNVYSYVVITMRNLCWNAKFLFGDEGIVRVRVRSEGGEIEFWFWN